MDAPTTTSADNGTSGDDGGGWFTPRKKATPPAESAEQTTPESEGPGRDGHIPEARRSTEPRSGEPVRADSSAADRMRTEPMRTEPRGADVDQAPAVTWPGPSTAAETAAPASDPASASAPAPRPAPSVFSRPGATALVEPARPARSSRPAVSAPEPAAPATSAPAAEPAAPSERGTGRPGSASLFTTGEAKSTEPRPAGTTGTGTDSGTNTDTKTGTDTAITAVSESPSPDAVLIQRTMAEVGPVADKVTSYFYALLFIRHPELRMLFPASMDTQRDRLLKALLTAAENLDNTEVLVSYLKNLGRGHRKYGTEPEHYPAVGEALIGSLSRYASSSWSEETEAAWVRAYTTISQVMIDAAAEDELKSPAWWFGEVVSHDLRTPDIAVITVRPDQPYPFLAGQYTSLETPWWPRVWRHYSFASAPRPDGLLTFHVKAVPAGWVSNALVHRARPGDTLRLGPPAGSMTVDHSTDNGLLCLGGGTGIAPIKAMVEDVAGHGARRPVEVFYGARTDHDLYDIDTMLRLQQTHPWLSVRPVIDRLDQHVQLPDAVREFGPWDEYDAYVSGPPGMIRNGVHALRNAGIPSDRIRHDSLEELVAAAD